MDVVQALIGIVGLIGLMMSILMSIFVITMILAFFAQRWQRKVWLGSLQKGDACEFRYAHNPDCWFEGRVRNVQQPVNTVDIIEAKSGCLVTRLVKDIRPARDAI